ncbi:MAG: hypothetical protein QOE26_2765 [Verrucomicrobiota bacterium]|jgi:hypothetical protein
MKLYCDITRQRFVQGFWLSAEITPFFTQNDTATFQVYLLAATGNSRFPFTYDRTSGKAGYTATATLCNPGGSPLTLTDPVSLDLIRNGFSGTITLDTQELVTFLTGRAERAAFLAIEVTDDAGSKVTSFMGEVSLCMAATAAETVKISSVIRRQDITSYMGGSESLEGIATIGLSLGTLWWVKINGSESHWELTEGSAASDPDSGIILTADGGQLVRTIGL